jgi:hypothetical protein
VSTHSSSVGAGPARSSPLAERSYFDLARGGDCWDGSTAYHPGAPELCDGGDNDCNGAPDDGIPFTNYWVDSDGDDYGAGNAALFCADPGPPWATAGGYCNEASAAHNPGAAETCDAVDNDCDGLVDPGAVCQ